MALSTESGGVIRFEGFELNPQTGELRKNGIRLSLQDQPFKVLVLLLQRPGEMVTREELRQLIWPEESFGDFDHAINRSVAKLRGVLGDSPDVPHLIETLPRRGYRFIGTVDNHVGKFPEPQPTTSTLKPSPVDSPRVPHLRRTALIVVSSMILVALVLGIWIAVPSPKPRVLRSIQLTNNGKSKCCVFTDGSRIYFSEFESGSYWRVKYIPVTGGDPIPLPIPSLESKEGSLWVQDISPDHDRLLVRLEALDSSLWSVPLSGTSARLLINFPFYAYRGAQWSRDGQLLAYASGPDLYLAKSDGTEPHKLLTAKGGVCCPVWSPDGTSLRYIVVKPNTSTLFEVSVRGGEPHEVTPHWEHLPRQFWGGGQWIPGGRYFVLFADVDNRPDMWAVREHRPFFSLGTRDPVRLTAGPVNYGGLAFSSDGKKIFTQGVEPRGEVERYDRKAAQFVPFRPALSAECCVYSYDGQWMAYVTFPDGDLWRSKPDGSQRQQLTWAPMAALNPHWSPDGKELAFTGFLPGKVPKTFVIPADGGDPHRLTQNECPELEANWSPDGERMTFGTYPEFARGRDGFSFVSDTACQVTLYSMDLKTNKISTIPGSEGLFAPRWSPDGKSIVAQDQRVRTLMLYDLTSGKWSELVPPSPGHRVGYPQWSKDGKWIYYRVWASAPADGAYRILISEHRIEEIADMSGINMTGWTAFDPDGNPLILRDLSLNEIYALDVDLP
jgi:Tol biopolymer transport system component/DNA-binding winged helix-turn-helix (wHTH) protein